MPVTGVVKLVVRCSGLRQCHSYFTTVRIHVGEVGRFLGAVGVPNAGQVRCEALRQLQRLDDEVADVHVLEREIARVEGRRIIKAVWLLPRDGGIGQHTAVARLVSGGHLHRSRAGVQFSPGTIFCISKLMQPCVQAFDGLS